MEILSKTHHLLGEGPIYNKFDHKLYQVDAMKDQICIIDLATSEEKTIQLDVLVSAVAFSKAGEMLICCTDGVFYLKDDGSRVPLVADGEPMPFICNDAKVGPDGRFYVGTQSGRRKGISDKLDGKLYSIDKNGKVRILLDGISLSNGLEWSLDEKLFYHADTDANKIVEYDFDIASGDISPTGRYVDVESVDGFTIGMDSRLYVACWAKGYITVVDTAELKIADRISVPAKIPASCAFVGENFDKLAVVSALYSNSTEDDTYGGYTFLYDVGTSGRAPYLFG